MIALAFVDGRISGPPDKVERIDNPGRVSRFAPKAINERHLILIKIYK